MKFYEAIEKINQSNSAESIIIPKYLLVEYIEQLREEYAPTVEMTKEQHDYISPLIQQGKDLGATFTEFWEVYKFIGASKKIDQTFVNQEQAMQVWLHQEIIKVVDE